MGLFQVIKQRWGAQATLGQVADDVADRCIEAVWSRVQHQVGSLATAEVRGYVRARGVAVVQPQLAIALNRHEIAASLKPQLYAMTVEAVIARVADRARDRAAPQSIRRAA